MNRVGVSYSVFTDAIELLEGSIRCIRPSVDHVNLAIQRMSYHGEPGDKETLDQVVSDLLRMNLIDSVVEYQACQDSPVEQERAKRNLGLNALEEAGCDYGMTMDCDEYYRADEFDYMRYAVTNGGFDGSACQIETYYKTTSHVLTPPVTYFVPMLFQIGNGRRFQSDTGFPVEVDSTRCMPCEYPKLFDRSEIQMHHFSYVRRDIESKLRNSSGRFIYARDQMRIKQTWDNFDGRTACVAGEYWLCKEISPSDALPMMNQPEFKRI